MNERERKRERGEGREGRKEGRREGRREREEAIDYEAWHSAIALYIYALSTRRQVKSASSLDGAFSLPQSSYAYALILVCLKAS